MEAAPPSATIFEARAVERIQMEEEARVSKVAVGFTGTHGNTILGRSE